MSTKKEPICPHCNGKALDNYYVGVSNVYEEFMCASCGKTWKVYNEEAYYEED